MKLRKVLAGAMALVMVASSLLVNPVATKADAQTIADLDCTGWWTAHTEGIEIYDGGTYTINLKTQYIVEWDVDSFDGDTNLGIVQENWEAPIFVLYNGNEARVGGDGYSEHYVGRADIWGWAGNSGATGSQTGTANCDWTNGWTPYVDAMKAGTDCKYVVTRDGATVKVVCTLANVETEYTVTLPATITDDKAVYFSLTGQCCTLEDITWTAPSAVELTGAVETLVVGETAQLGATLKTVANTTDTVAEAVTWTSSKEEVATVDATGKVTAVAPGTTTIKATSGDVYAECTITIAAAVNHITAIDVTADKTEIKVGNTAQLSVAYTAEKADEDITDSKTVTYKSSDDKIATVDATGKVTAVAPGKVTITASVLDGTITDTIEITVPAVPVTEIVLEVADKDLEKGDIVNIKATVNPADTTDDTTITWTSSNEKVATVDANGNVTAVGGGNATITAAIGDVKAEVTFKVTAYETVVNKSTMDDITIEGFLSAQTDGLQLKKGHTYTITFDAKGTDAAATNLYEAPCFFVYTNSENKFNTADYKELFFARADVWCWANGDATNSHRDALPEGFTFNYTAPADWDAWLAALKNGSECVLTAKYDGTNVTISCTVGDALSTSIIPVGTVPAGSTLYLGLTGEKVALTDITVADEYVKTITGKGDVNALLPIVLVLFGGAAVIVASKKRFA